MTRLLLQVEQLNAGADNGQANQGAQGLTPPANPQLLPCDWLLHEALEQGEVGVQQHPLQLLSHLAPIHTPAHSPQRQHHHAAEVDKKGQQSSHGSGVSKGLYDFNLHMFKNSLSIKQPF